MIITSGGLKGGSAKTTTIFSLTQRRQAEIGLGKVLLIDADTKTSSSTRWAAIRSLKDLPQLGVIQKSGSKDFIQVVRSLAEKYQDIFIDVGGGNDSELKAAMVVSDIFLNPLQPSQLDAFTISNVDAMVGEAKIFNSKLKALVVPSVVSPNVLMVADDLAELIELTDDLENMTRSNSVIKSRKSYKKAVKQGKTIFELEGKDYDQKAVDEMNNLYYEVFSDQR